MFRLIKCRESSLLLARHLQPTLLLRTYALRILLTNVASSCLGVGVPVTWDAKSREEDRLLVTNKRQKSRLAAFSYVRLSEPYPRENGEQPWSWQCQF